MAFNIKFELINHLPVRPQVLICLLLATALILSKPELHAQELNYTRYTVESGLNLPSNEVYRILFDKNGVLWASTDHGVWRYDGYSSRQFTVSDGLKENSNLRMFMDPGNGIWVSSMNNYLYGIINDTVHMNPASEEIHALGKSSEYIQHIYFSPDSTLYLNHNYPGLFLIKPGKSPEKLTGHLLNHEDASLAIHYDSAGFYFDMIGLPDTNPETPTLVKSENGWIYLKCGAAEKKHNYRKELYPIGKNEFIVSFVSKVFHIKDGKLKAEKAFNTDITSLFVDKTGNFWVGLENEGVMLFPNMDFTSNPIRYLAGETVSGIQQDHEGSYWFATTLSGIYQANTLDLEVYNKSEVGNKDKIINALASDGENIYLGTETGILLKGTEEDNQKFKFREFKIPRINGPIRKIFYTPEKHLLVFNMDLLELDTSGKYRGIGKIASYSYAYQPLDDGKWLVSASANLSLFQGDRIIKRWLQKDMDTSSPYEKFVKNAMNRVRAMNVDTSKRLWLGSQNSGLLSTSDSILYPWSQRDSLLGRRIHWINQVGKDIWASVADYGFAVIHPDSSVTRITQADGLSSDIIETAFVENDTIVWAGTNNGLNKITLESATGKLKSITYFTMREGLPSNKINQIIKHKNNIWVATNQGAIRLSPSFNQIPAIPPQLSVGPLLVNDRPILLTSSVTLGPDDNDLVFYYKTITYRKPVRMHYQYKLVGVDKEFIVTDNLEARYPDLRQGNYTFCINASYDGTFDPSTEKKYTIIIQRHFYETRLAILLYILLGSGLIYLIVIKILQAVKTREMEKRQLLQAEKRSLLAQMNPHFIFNSLNSIEHFIVQHDERQANNYLSNFSGLIRRILDNSKKNLIPLQEEITTLSLYLGMEKLRFENDFEFQITKDELIEYNEMMIPPMMLQPFVENAIWHGLLPSKKKGILKISFLNEGDYFKCIIVDNGIGREKASSLKSVKRSHVPTGIRNIEERIDLLNKLNKKKIRLTINDLKSTDGKATGTLVEITIPVELRT